MEKQIEVNRDIKQVLVMRTDLQCRKGKMIAQGAHASIHCLLDAAYSGNLTYIKNTWVCEGMTKIVCRVDSEDQLLEVYQKARAAKLEVHLITDAGLTEFAGPTKTCLAIGPDRTEKINKITGDLKLL